MGENESQGTTLSVPMMQTYRSVIVKNSDSEEFEITSGVSEINIFEDIYSNTLTGNIVYSDDHGALDSVKFKANEKITIELYKTSKGDEVSTHDFFIFQISDNERIKDGASVYVIHFISIESVINANTRVHSAISGSCSDAVKKLFKYLQSEKALETEDTNGVYKFTMNSRTPLECINWYAGRSISSETSGSYYLFYETLSNGFAYKCIDTLVSKDAKYTYRYEPSGHELVAKDVTNVREYEVINVMNSISGTDEMYSTLWNSDSLRKKITKTKFSIDGNKKGQLNGGALLSSLPSNNGFDIDMSERREAFGMKNMVRNEVRQTHTQTQSYYYDAIQPKLSAMRQYESLKVKLLVFGNRDIQIGQTVNLNLTKTKMFDVNSKSEAMDDTLSGKYLVTAVRYLYKINKFDMVLELVKDTKK